jgi:ABC-2 type transport system ATP-binding protein
VRRLRDEHGVTVFMTTHYMDEADNCDRIAVIDHGRIVAIGTPEELRRQVGREAVLVGTADAAALAAEVARRYGVQADVTSRPGELRIEVDDAAAFLPRLAADFAGRVDSLRVHRPTLDDVFLHLTGREIREEEQGALEQMRMFMGRRRR